MNYLQHPLSAAFPAMQFDEYQALVDSIVEIGVQNPITLYEGMVLDGWHRYSAANESGMVCPSVELGGVDPRDFVLAQNKARRNLTRSQRADSVTAVHQWRPAHREKKQEVTSTLSKTNAELAAIAGVSVKTIQQAKAVHAGAVQAVQDAVKTGAVTVEVAAAVAKLPTKEQKKIAAKGPDAMRAAVKPAVVEPSQEAPPDYTELDAAHDSNSELRAALAVANMGNVAEEDKQQATSLIAELRAEVKTLTATLKAVTLSRDSLMEETTQMKRQMQMQRKEIDKLKNNK